MVVVDAYSVAPWMQAWFPDVTVLFGHLDRVQESDSLNARSPFGQDRDAAAGVADPALLGLREIDLQIFHNLRRGLEGHFALRLRSPFRSSRACLQ